VDGKFQPEGYCGFQFDKTGKMAGPARFTGRRPAISFLIGGCPEIREKTGEENVGAICRTVGLRGKRIAGGGGPQL